MQPDALLSARDSDIVLAARNRQAQVLGERLAVKQTALLEIMDAVTLAEAKRIARAAHRWEVEPHE